MSRRPEIFQEAQGLVPDGVCVLLVEAESKLMEAKYRGARAGGASDGMRTICSARRTYARTPTGFDVSSRAAFVAWEMDDPRSPLR